MTRKFFLFGKSDPGFTLWPFDKAPETFRKLCPGAAWVLHCPSALARRFAEMKPPELPMILNTKVEGSFKPYMPGFGFAERVEHPKGDGFLIAYREG